MAHYVIPSQDSNVLVDEFRSLYRELHNREPDFMYRCTSQELQEGIDALKRQLERS